MNSVGKVAILLDYWTDPGFQYHVAEKAKDRTVVFERSSFVPLDYEAVRRTFPELTAAPNIRKRKRKPSLVSVAKQVAKAGIEVARYEVDPDTGKISVIVGQADDATASNPWDEVLSNVKN
ncbi:MAG TPA: hypothetical protein VK804_02780 [Bradyrhizobium sp.]|jgi:hypothetical protein|uniref:hypothetical protein n=1 Tax=Bradyrhizobium sp. TaxID=376 RepID=UPI002C0E22E1|nr:hypothetical protein [Bradyrhizobium sp.]HTA99375.1 hypothetical protein [Bradyrhizobium sp.]